MHLPVVSAIVPVFNGAATVARCVRSLIAQTFQDIEIIVVDDGSTDKTPDILKELAREDRRVRLIRQSNQGVGCARNTGLDAARGTWICFVDADDYVAPDYIAAAYTTAAAQNADCVVHNFYVENPSGARFPYPFRPQKHTLTGREAALETFELWAFPAMVTLKFFRRAIIRENNLRFPPILYEDLYFSTVFFLNAERVIYIPHPRYHYLRDAGTLTHDFTDRHCREFLTSFNLIRHYITEHGEWQDWQDDMSRVILRLQMHLGFSVIFLSRNIPLKERWELFSQGSSILSESAERPDPDANPYQLLPAYDIPARYKN